MISQKQEEQIPRCVFGITVWEGERLNVTHVCTRISKCDLVTNICRMNKMGFFCFLTFYLFRFNVIYLNLERNIFFFFFKRSFFLDRTVWIFIKLNGILFVNIEFDINEWCKIEYNVSNDGHSQWISTLKTSNFHRWFTAKFHRCASQFTYFIENGTHTHETKKKQKTKTRKYGKNAEPFGVRTLKVLI